MILNILLVVWKSKTLRPPSEYCLISVFLFTYSVFFFQTKWNKSESMATHVLQSIIQDRAGYTNLVKPSALQSKIQPKTVSSLCNQQLKIDLDFSTFSKKFWEILLSVDLFIVIPRYFTTFYLYAIYWKIVRIMYSHYLTLSLLIVRPEVHFEETDRYHQPADWW